MREYQDRAAIAIVGLGLHFPGAHNVEEYWQRLLEGRDLSQDSPPGRWPEYIHQRLSSTFQPDTLRNKRGYYLDTIPTPASLGLPEGIDPLFCLALATARQTIISQTALPLEETGLIMASIALPTDTTSNLSWEVLGGDFLKRLRTLWPQDRPCPLPAANPQLPPAAPYNVAAVGLPAQLVAAQLHLGLGGYTLDAACASSLVAIELACRELLAGRAQAMLAGGLSRPDSLYTQMGFSALRALSPSGLCAPFDKRADGLMVGEGCGLVLLKTLERAQADGDHIYAIIRGAGISNDLQGNLLAPSSEGQLRCLRQAYQSCHLEPWQVELIECHGTGTPVGDKVELESLRQLWEGAPAQKLCQLRSVKAMVGHLLTAAGAAGLIRTVLNLEKGQITPQVNFQESAWDLESTPFRISSQLQEWPQVGPEPRRAAVSGFGFGGINAHLILEEYRSPAAELTPLPTIAANAAPSPAADEEEPVAIVGLACHLGPLENLDSFQRALFQGLELSEPLPPQRWQGIEGPSAGGNYIDKFSFPLGRFRIPPADLDSILPQQSALLTCAAQALLDAGEPLRQVRQRAGAFIGIALDPNTTNFNLRWNLPPLVAQWAKELGLSPAEEEEWLDKLQEDISAPLDATRTLGALGSIAASRVAREFQFGGSSFSLSAQELSGLEALKLGLDSLRAGHLDLVLVGAIDLQGDIRQALTHLSPQEQGLDSEEPLYSEGVCTLVLKRLSEAQAAGDRIYAVLRGVGLSQGELSKACAQSWSKPQNLSYLELANSLWLEESSTLAPQLLNLFKEGQRPLAVGSLERLIGQTGCVSALASVLKSALCLYRHALPATPNFTRPLAEPQLWQDSRLFAPRQSAYWYRNRAQGKRQAGVLARAYPDHYGAALLEEVEESPAEAKALSSLLPPSALVVVAAGPEPAAITQRLSALLAELENLPASELTPAQQRQTLAALSLQWYRESDLQAPLAAAIVLNLEVENPLQDLKRDLELALQHVSEHPQESLERGNIYYHPQPLAAQGKVAFVYPGSGANFLGLGRELALRFPAQMEALDSRQKYLADEFMARWNQPYALDWSEGWQHRAWERLSADTHQMMFSQVSFAMLSTAVVRHLGIEPQAAIGYSLGESAALFSLGAWPDPDLMYERMQSSELFRKDLSGPCRSARQAWQFPAEEPFTWVVGLLRLPAPQVSAAMEGIERIRLLIVNTDTECVVGGVPQALEELCRRLHTQAITVSGVDTVHCDCLAPVARQYWEMHHLPCTPPPGIDFYSAYFQKAYPLTSEAIADSIAGHGQHGFNYPATIRQAWADGVRLFLEMGPGASCTRMIRSILRDEPHAAYSLSVRNQNEALSLAHFLAAVLSQGLRPNLVELWGQLESAPAAIPSKDLRLGRAPYAPALPKFPTLTQSAPALSEELTPAPEAAPPAAPNFPAQPIAPAPALSTPAPAPQSAPTPQVAAVPTSTFNPHPWVQLLQEGGQWEESLHRQWLAFTQQSAQGWAEIVNRQSQLVAALQGQGYALAAPLPLESLPLEPQAQVQIQPQPQAQVQVQVQSPTQGQEFPPLESRSAYLPMLAGRQILHPGAYAYGPKPSLAPPSLSLFLDRDQCLEFAVGKIGQVLGPKFAPIDSYSTRVRLPAEPLMLVDRILEVEGEPLSLGSGRVVTEHDVLEGIWYLDGGRAPVFISVEAGQADLFLCSWLGIDFKAQGQRVYRLLDAQVTFHRGLPQPGETIRYDIRIRHFLNQGETWLFFFEYDSYIGDQPFSTMRNGCAGFFTYAEIENNGGLILSADRDRPAPGKCDPNYRPLLPLQAESYGEEVVEALRQGRLEALGAPFANLALKDPVRLPDGLLALIHRIPECDPQGGRWGLGRVVGEADVHPQDWYLVCHFCDDMVMPGTLMYDCCAQALRFLLTRLGWVGERQKVAYEPVPGCKVTLKCRGPVLATTKTVRYQIEIKELGYNPAPYVIAEAVMYADGKPIVGFEDMSLQLSGLDREYLEGLWQVAEHSLHRGDPPKKAVFTEEQLLELATGLPSKALGPEFAPFDGRFLARLPGPPYQFLSRITQVDQPYLDPTPGGWVEAQYDIPPQAWYFAANRTGNMPYCVLNEIALQACGWVSSYVGGSRYTQEPLYYRNLGGQATLYREITPQMGTLTIRVRLTKSAQAGGLIIHDFQMWMGQLGETIYEGTTHFGFFTASALANQVGVRGGRQKIWQPDQPLPFRPLERTAPLAPADSHSSPHAPLSLPSRALLMLDEWAWYPQGGWKGLGAVVARKQVDPSDWFFKAHFYQDPVIPGSLGLESCLEALKAAALEIWPQYRESHTFSAILLERPHRWLYRGQIIPRNCETTVHLSLTERGSDERPYLKGDCLVCADGTPIYELQDFGVSLDVVLT